LTAALPYPFPYVVTVTVGPPNDADTSSTPFRPTALMERTSEKLTVRTSPATTNELTDGPGGKSDHRRLALALLIAEGYVGVADGPNRSKLHTFLKAYRQADDPLSDAYVKRDAPSAPGGYVVPPSLTTGDGTHPLTCVPDALGTHSGRTP
jgi:hypothetical protein